MAGFRRWAVRTTRPIRVAKKLTSRGRRAYAKMGVRKVLTTLSPGTARTGRKIAHRYATQRSLLKIIKK